MPNLIHILFGIVVGLIITGALLVYMVGMFFNQQGEETFVGESKGDIPKDPEILLENMENTELDKFEQELDEIYHQLEGLTPIDEPKEIIEKEIKEAIETVEEEKIEKLDGSRHREIYQAFDAGESITDLARNFRKNKGEIELILNLRGRDDREEVASG